MDAQPTSLKERSPEKDLMFQTTLFFGNDKCQHGVFFVAHTESDVADALFFQPFGQGGGVEEFGFAQCVMPDADVAEGNRAAYARADGFGEGFFGGKAFGEVVDGFACLRKFEQLFGRKDALGKRLSELFAQADDAFEGNDVCAYAVNHAVVSLLREGRLKKWVLPYQGSSLALNMVSFI